LIGLGLLKYVVFAILFFVTMGKLKLWIFPNLTEDVGFFESFVPMYELTWTGGKKKDKDSDDEEEEDDSENEQDEKKVTIIMYPNSFLKNFISVAFNILIECHRALEMEALTRRELLPTKIPKRTNPKS
jgi:hypothetical protein